MHSELKGSPASRDTDHFPAIIFETCAFQGINPRAVNHPCLFSHQQHKEVLHKAPCWCQYFHQETEGANIIEIVMYFWSRVSDRQCLTDHSLWDRLGFRFVESAHWSFWCGVTGRPDAPCLGWVQSTDTADAAARSSEDPASAFCKPSNHSRSLCPLCNLFNLVTIRGFSTHHLLIQDFQKRDYNLNVINKAFVAWTFWYKIEATQWSSV